MTYVARWALTIYGAMTIVAFLLEAESWGLFFKATTFIVVCVGANWYAQRWIERWSR